MCVVAYKNIFCDNINRFLCLPIGWGNDILGKQESVERLLSLLSEFPLDSLIVGLQTVSACKKNIELSSGNLKSEDESLLISWGSCSKSFFEATKKVEKIVCDLATDFLEFFFHVEIALNKEQNRFSLLPKCEKN